MSRNPSISHPRAHSSAVVKITPADIARLREHGPAAIDYYRRFGLAEARSRGVGLVLSGVVPVVGLLLLGWTPTAMVIFMLIDAWMTVVCDWLRLTLAAPWMRASHERDHLAGEMVGIVDGLEDGSGVRSARGNAPGPEVIVVIASVCSLFMIPIAGAALEPMGLASVREVLSEQHFLWLVAADAVLRFFGTLVAARVVRQRAPGEAMLFAESGGVAVLQAGLLALVWLPLNWGQTGLLLMFALLYLFRIGFGAFAWWWMPRAVVALERRMASGDYSVRSA